MFFFDDFEMLVRSLWGDVVTSLWPNGTGTGTEH